MNEEVFLTKKTKKFECYTIEILEASDDDLRLISEKMGLALDLSEMKKIKEYF